MTMKNEPSLEESVQHFAEIYANFNISDEEVLVAVYNMDDKLERLLTTHITAWDAFESLAKDDPKTQFQYVLITEDTNVLENAEVKYSWLPPVDHETEITTEAEANTDKE